MSAFSGAALSVRVIRSLSAWLSIAERLLYREPSVSDF
jgi:hypothetical protein